MTLFQRALWQSSLQHSAVLRVDGTSDIRTLLRVPQNSTYRKRCVTRCSLSIPGENSSSSEEVQARATLSLTAGALDKADAKRNGVRPRAHGGSHSSGQFDKDDGLPASMFAPYPNLPPDGRSIAEEEESCNPEERRCRTPVYVWESKCKACFGTGLVTSRSKRGRSSYTCIACSGIGYVRKSSVRMIPDLNDGTGNMTLGRQSSAKNVPKPGQNGNGRSK